MGKFEPDYIYTKDLIPVIFNQSEVNCDAMIVYFDGCKCGDYCWIAADGLGHAVKFESYNAIRNAACPDCKPGDWEQITIGNTTVTNLREMAEYYRKSSNTNEGVVSVQTPNSIGFSEDGFYNFKYVIESGPSLTEPLRIAMQALNYYMMQEYDCQVALEAVRKIRKITGEE